MGCGLSFDDNGAGVGADEDLQNELQHKQMEKPREKDDNDQALFKEAENESVEQFMAVKPWIGALKAPTNAPQVDFTAPEMGLELEYVNGYRAEDTRQNLYFTQSNDQIIYMTAAVGVRQDISSNQQFFYGAGKVGAVDGHNDDIESLHIHPNRQVFATGQRGKNPLVIAWDIATGKILFKANQGVNTRAAQLLKFSKDGKYIFTVDIHNDNNVHVFDWQQGKKIATQKTGGEPIFDMDTSSGSFAGAIGHKRGLSFLSFEGGLLEIKKGISGAQGIESQTAVAYTSNPNTCISGSVKGEFYVWEGNTARRKFQAHQGSINSIAILDGLIFSSGNTDKSLIVWDEKTQQQQQTHQIPSHARAIDHKDGKILVGTRDGQILTISSGTQQVVINGHGTGETWGLDLSADGLVVTSGDDNKIITFDPKTNKAIAQGTINTKPGIKQKIGGASTLSLLPPNQQSRAVAVSSKTGHVVVCTNIGEVSVRAGITDLDNQIFYSKLSKEWIEIAKYSPDGSKLAIGSHDNDIYILDVNNNYNLISKLQAHKSYICGLDWSEDGNNIQSVCGAYEYLFFDVQSGQQLQSGATQLRDEQWATFSCKLGWPVQGIFPPATDGTHVNIVDRSKSKRVFATGDDWGFVNLYRNPNNKGSKANSYRAHSSHVVRVLFDSSDKYLYSVGGYDRTLMKWRVV